MLSSKKYLQGFSAIRQLASHYTCRQASQLINLYLCAHEK